MQTCFFEIGADFVTEEAGSLLYAHCILRGHPNVYGPNDN